MSPSDAWFSSFRIWNLIRLSVLTCRSASVNASTIVAGASGLSSVSRSGRPIRCPRPRFSKASSSWQTFSTMRVMLPVTTDSSIADVSTSVSFVGSTSA
ncbi:MAG: hypothetical protein IPI87_08730 [Betaproteobacteria bacterium]|nr:hypothetical protein [Betaproteobacteria bacterium]